MLSIITVCHKSSDLLTPYIATFLKHHSKYSKKNTIEFIFVENSGDHRTEDHAVQLREGGFDTKVVMVENHGFGAGCNAGARIARGNIIVFANPDIQFLTDITLIEDIFTDKKWGTILQRSGKRNAEYAFDLLPEYRTLATEILRFYRYAHHFKPLYRFFYAVGSFMIVPREAFFELGGFDERFFLYYEEAELSRRLQLRLGPPSYSNSISILHEGFGTQTSSDFTFREEARGMATYSAITMQPKLVKQRIRMLKFLSLLSKGASKRAAYLQEEIDSRNRI